MLRVFEGVDELRPLVGQRLGKSLWHVVDQERIEKFAEATEDRQWIHLDVERAARGPYGSTIAHGFLTLCLLPVMVAEIYRVEGVRFVLNYGLNRVRFPAPVPVGSKLQAVVDLIAVDDVADAVQVVILASIERCGGTKPVCVAESIRRIYT